MKMVFRVKIFAAMMSLVTDRKVKRAAALDRREPAKKSSVRQTETAAAELSRCWRIENIDGRNEEKPTYMLPLILSGHTRQ